MDIQLLIVTALLGIFGTVIFYVSKIFNKTESLVDQVKDDSKEPAIATDLHSRKKNNSESNVICNFKVLTKTTDNITVSLIAAKYVWKEIQRTKNIIRERQAVRSQMASDNP